MKRQHPKNHDSQINNRNKKGQFKKNSISWNKTPQNVKKPIKRICIKCKKEKSFNKFTKDKTCAFGRSYTCKRCTADNAKRRYAKGLCYQKKGRKNPLLSNTQKKINRITAHKKWAFNNCEKISEYGKRKTEELSDNYISCHYKSRYGKLSLQMIKVIRCRILMNRTLKEFKQWREENESNYTDVHGKQFPDEKNYERGFQA